MIETSLREGKTYTPLENLKSWDKNPRNITDSDLQRLKNQLQELGQYKPLIVTTEGVVIGGNMRLRAMKESGVKEAWVSIITPETEKN